MSAIVAAPVPSHLVVYPHLKTLMESMNDHVGFHFDTLIKRFADRPVLMDAVTYDKPPRLFMLSEWSMKDPVFNEPRIRFGYQSVMLARSPADNAIYDRTRNLWMTLTYLAPGTFEVVPDHAHLAVEIKAETLGATEQTAPMNCMIPCPDLKGKNLDEHFLLYSQLDAVKMLCDETAGYLTDLPF